MVKTRIDLLSPSSAMRLGLFGYDDTAQHHHRARGAP